MRHTLPHWLERIERFVDRAVPFVLIGLTILIIIEFSHVADKYHDVIVYIDYGVIVFFVVDLCFKWYHTRDALKFIRLYWIDIIAVFPFYAIFRVYLAASELIAAGEQTQKILHEAVLLREANLLKEAELLREAEYTSKLAKEGGFVRLFARGLRVMKARWYVAHGHLQKVSRGYSEEHRRN